MASGSFLINHGKHGMGMLLPQRSSSMTHVFRTQKVPFVTMIHVEEKIGLPPVKRLKIQYKALNNNVMVGNKLRPKKEDRPHEKYCSLTVDKQFWRKNINPYLELKREPWQLTGNKMIDRFNSNKLLSEELSKHKSKQLLCNNNDMLNENKEVNKEQHQHKQQHESECYVKIKKKICTKNRKNSSLLHRESRNKLRCNGSYVNCRRKMALTKEEEVDTKKNITVDIDNDNAKSNAELLEEGEIQNIVNYMSGLDFEKYSKDMEIKEALRLLKYKMEKHAEEMKHTTGDVTDVKGSADECDNNNNASISDMNEKETTQENEDETNEDSEHKVVKPIVNEQEEKKQEDIDKFKMAEQISKNKILRKVHSCKSIQKLLDREGMNHIHMIDTTKIKHNDNNNNSRNSKNVSNKLPSIGSRNKCAISVPDI